VTAAWGFGLTTYAADESVLDVWFPTPALGEKPEDAAPAAELKALEGSDALRRVEKRVELVEIDLDAAPASTQDVWLRLHLLSHRLVQPHGQNLDGIFGLLTNVVWTSEGPCAVDGFELVVRAVLGQQVSVAAARRVAARLVQAYGKPLDTPVGGVTHAFPTSDALAAVDPSEFPMPARRQRTMHELTARLADGRIRLDPGADRAEVERVLTEIPGIGSWTAGYVRMRALADPDVFLVGDLGVRHGLVRAGLPDDSAAAAKVAEVWRPWRSYAQMHLWTSTTAEGMTGNNQKGIQHD